MNLRWRGVLAALLNPDLRAALAEVSAEPLTGARRDRAFARLEELGLVARRGDGDWVFDDTLVRGILAETPRATRSGAERFLDPAGRIDRYPQRADDRCELLRWVADAALPHGTVWTERDVNDLLAPLAPGGDVAVLRRYLVDHGLLARTRTGSAYTRVADSAV